MKRSEQVEELAQKNLKKYRAIVAHANSVSLHSIAVDVGIDRKRARDIIRKFEDFGSVKGDLNKIIRDRHY